MTTPLQPNFGLVVDLAFIENALSSTTSTTISSNDDDRKVTSKSQQKSRRRACVVLILRENNFDGGSKENNIELLFIRRAINPKDKWSGHMGFPGGKQEFNESDIETCIRETYEEIGIDLSSVTQAQNIGRLNDTWATSTYSIGVYVYKLLISNNNEITLKLDPKEVSDVIWVPLKYFISSGNNNNSNCFNQQQHETTSKLYPVQSTLPIQYYKSSSSSGLLLFLQPIISIFFTIHFPCVYLPRGKQESIETIQSHHPKRTDPHDFILWGITLGIVKDFFHRLNTYYYYSTTNEVEVSNINTIGSNGGATKNHIIIPLSSLELQLNPTPIKTKIILFVSNFISSIRRRRKEKKTMTTTMTMLLAGVGISAAATTMVGFYMRSKGRRQQ